MSDMDLDYENLTSQDIEMIYITVLYSCGHPMLRAIRRHQATSSQLMGHDREIDAWEKCQNCDAITAAKNAARDAHRAGDYLL